MPPRRELPLRGARDDPKAWPPSSAPLRLVVPPPPRRLLAVAPSEPRPPFTRTRERVSVFFGPWRSPNLSQRCCAIPAWLFDFCNRLSRTHGHCSRGPDPRATKGIAPHALPHPVALSRSHSSPLRRPSSAVCCSEPRSSLRRSTLRPNPLRRTRRPATPQPPFRAEEGNDMRETWAGGPRDLGRSTLMDCRPSVHRGGLASDAFQLELQPSISCHRRR